jgi:hypothetical protein
MHLFAGNEHGRAFRDIEMENKVLELTRKLGIGAQFGGKYFCHDVRVVRLPRHGASCPVGIGVSCSADRQVSDAVVVSGRYLYLPAKLSFNFLIKIKIVCHMSTQLYSKSPTVLPYVAFPCREF